MLLSQVFTCNALDLFFSSLGVGVHIGSENKYQHYMKGYDLKRDIVSYKHDICLSWQEN